MIKRIFDLAASLILLTFFSPILLLFFFLVWIQDFHNPLYISYRVGRKEKPFKMIKLRSMVVNADKCGVDSTSNSDSRITRVGKIIRAYKLDELTQLWNVIIGDMSIVGPRPNVKRETDLYTSNERLLLSIRPGITDYASIVFADEGDILKDSNDPNIDYNQLIRPGKGMLGLFYVENSNFFMDIRVCIYTAVSFVSRELSLKLVSSDLKLYGANQEIIKIAERVEPLIPRPPIGSSEIVIRR